MNEYATTDEVNDVKFVPRTINREINSKQLSVNEEKDEKPDKATIYTDLCYKKIENKELTEYELLQFDSLMLEIDKDKLIYNNILTKHEFIINKCRRAKKEIMDKFNKKMETLFNDFFVVKKGAEINRADVGEIVLDNQPKRDRIQKTHFFKWITDNFPDVMIKRKSDGYYFVGIDLIGNENDSESLIPDFIANYPWKIDELGNKYDVRDDIYDTFCMVREAKILNFINKSHFGRLMTKYAIKKHKNKKPIYCLIDSKL